MFVDDGLYRTAVICKRGWIGDFKIDNQVCGHENQYAHCSRRLTPHRVRKTPLPSAEFWPLLGRKLSSRWRSLTTSEVKSLQGTVCAACFERR